MNHIYKSLYNASLGAWVAVPEIAKGRSKSAGNGKSQHRTFVSRKFTVSALAIALLQIISGQAAAAADTCENVGTALKCGINAQVFGESSITVGQNAGLFTETKTSAQPNVANYDLTGNVSLGAESGVVLKAGQLPKDPKDKAINKKYNTTLGYGTKSYGSNNVAIGKGSIAGFGLGSEAYQGDKVTPYPTHDNAVAIGNGALARQKSSIAIGDEAEVRNNGANAIAIGREAVAGDHEAVAIGDSAKGLGIVSVAVGNLTEATIRSTAVGYSSKANSFDAVAVGSNAKTWGVGSVSIGHTNNVGASGTGNEADYSVGIGDSNRVNASRSAAIGYKNIVEKNATGSFVFGSRASAGGSGVVSIGNMAKASRNNSVAIGNNAQSTGINSVAIGPSAGSNETAGSQYAVFIGQNAGGSNTSSSGNTHGISIGNGAGQHMSAGTENVAIGHASGQYVHGNTNYALGTRTGQYVSGANNYSMGISAGQYVNGNGNFIGGVNAGQYIGDKTAKKSSSNNIIIGTNANKMTADNPLLTSDNIAIGRDSKATGGESISIGHGNTVSGARSGAIGDPTTISGSGTYSVGNNNGTVTADEAGVFGNNNTLEGNNSRIIGNRNTVSVENTFVVGNDVNASQGNSVILGNKSADREATAETQAVISAGSGFKYVTYGNFAGVGAPDKGVVSVGAAGKERQIINVAAGKVSEDSTDAINGSQLYAVAKEAAKGRKYQGDFAESTNNEFQQSLGETTIIKGGVTDTDVLTKNNIGVVSNGINTLTVKLKKNLDLGSDGSVTMGDSKISDNGLEITNGPSVTKGGIDAGNKKITNVADGSADGDAVNFGQLKTVKNKVDNLGNSVTNIFGGNAGIDADGNVSTNNIGGTGENNIDDAIKKVVSDANTAAAKAKTEVKAGDNIEVEDKIGTSGQTIYTVKTKKNVAFDKVSVGNVAINGSANTITGLEKGAVNAGSTDAVNGSQLFDTAASIAKSFGGNSNVNPDGTVTAALDVGGTPYSDVNTALNAINAEAGKRNTVTNGKNIVVTPTSQTDGTTQFEVATVNDLTADSFTAGDTKISDNGLEITNGPSVTKSGIDAGNQKITNVAAGSDDGDAVNVKQLKTVEQQVSNLSSGGAGVVQYSNAANPTQPNGGTATNDVTLVGADAAKPVTIHNVGAGRAPTDAVNMSQLHGVAHGLNNRINDVDDRAKSGVASAMATAGLPQVYLPGKSMVAAAASVYRGEPALAVGVSAASDNGKWVIKGTANANRKDSGVTVGIGYQW